MMSSGQKDEYRVPILTGLPQYVLILSLDAHVLVFTSRISVWGYKMILSICVSLHLWAYRDHLLHHYGCVRGVLKSPNSNFKWAQIRTIFSEKLLGSFMLMCLFVVR